MRPTSEVYGGADICNKNFLRSCKPKGLQHRCFSVKFAKF